MIRRAFVHDRRGAVGQRAVDDVAVPGHPADVGRTPVDVVLAAGRRPICGVSDDAEQVAGRGVQNALGFAGRAAGVEDEERMFAVERLGGAIGRGVGHQLVPPEVAARLHVDLLIAAIEDDALLDRRRLGQGGIDVLLERHDLAAPPAAVGGDDQLGLGVVVAVGDGLGARSRRRRR